MKSQPLAYFLNTMHICEWNFNIQLKRGGEKGLTAHKTKLQYLPNAHPWG
jgi:hypothetical protein